MKFKNFVNEDSKIDIKSDEQILRESIREELNAINLYQGFAAKTRNPDLKRLLLDVAFEEKVHVEEFEELLEQLDPELEDAEDEAEEEIENKGLF